MNGSPITEYYVNGHRVIVRTSIAQNVCE